MAKIILLLFLQGFLICSLQGQSFTVDDLVTLSSLSPKKFDNYMQEKGYVSGGRKMQDDAMAFTFFEKRKLTPADTIFESRNVGLYKKEDEFCFAFNTTCRKDYEDGLLRLKTNNFFQGETEDTSASAPLFFQKGNLSVYVSSGIGEEDTSLVYTFLLKKKQLPDGVQFAEDLLSFDSHELLASYFGVANVQKDVYYFSEKKIKKCSVLFGNSNRQVVFVWEDEKNLRKLSYILITGILPTETGLPFNDNIGRNKWVFKSGIYSGMSIRDLLKLNGSDFKFYGLDTEYSMMIEPEITGSIDFKKTGIMLSSLDGTGPSILKRAKVSAEDAVENRIALHVFYIMLTP